MFPCGENMVCIIDDREDVWDYASNLIHVKPYRFFQHTGDIHAPPGLTKCENDDNKLGFDFTQLEKTSSNTVGGCWYSFFANPKFMLNGDVRRSN